jgi:hypothetical protein
MNGQKFREKKSTIRAGCGVFEAPAEGRETAAILFCIQQLEVVPSSKPWRRIPRYSTKWNWM